MQVALICGAVVAVIFWVAAMRARSCPECRADLPRFRKPTSWRQALWGGWTCPKCRAELDRAARKAPAS